LSELELILGRTSFQDPDFWL